METSGFTAEQMAVREAISKICSNYSDVRTLNQNIISISIDVN
jgi:hypothetical protein